MPGNLESMYSNATIKIIAKLDAMSETITKVVKENASATAGITQSIDSLTASVKELSDIIKTAYKLDKQNKED